MKRIILPYNRILKERARRLRNNMTLSEVLLWNEMKRKKILGIDFDRQRPILNYIVDFYCKDLRLAIEVDGGIHDHQIEYDRYRQKNLERVGVSFLRFTDVQVVDEMEWVVLRIRERVLELKSKSDNPPPAPPRRGE